ncbi:hypothetical protein IEQ34_010654 [Dendrobium chrysotoxum]|uniref:Uncharacterized protein n=1 Tax=Dendrobium chrysotoxum TaxID=161865 RepID=A0AAV7GTD2_DENCH|nr:hypothetical protein IEQ34_010654 [Dendrobium chrysotoxum]
MPKLLLPQNSNDNNHLDKVLFEQRGAGNAKLKINKMDYNYKSLLVSVDGANLPQPSPSPPPQHHT